jgi:DNA-binding transcriptional MocR family regulator
MLNLRLNYPSVNQEMDVFQAYTQSLAAPEKYTFLQPPGYVPTSANAKLICDWLEVENEVISQQSHIVAVPSANSALYCVLTLMRQATPTIGAEVFTFPGFRFCAMHLGYQINGIACDEEGMLPDALQDYLLKTSCKLIYLQPTVHNPTCSVMSLQRRLEIVAVLQKFKEVYILEDDAYRFLHPDPPPSFLQLLPERTIHVYSFSKAFNPLLKSAYIIYPKGILAGMEEMIQFTTSSACSIAINFGIALIKGEQLKNIIKEKQQIARHWHTTIVRLFQGLSYRMFPSSFHIWLKLENGLSAAALTSFLLTKEIDVAEGDSFAVNGDTEHVRIALGAAWDSDRLVPALETIATACSRGV